MICMAELSKALFCVLQTDMSHIKNELIYFFLKQLWEQFLQIGKIRVAKSIVPQHNLVGSIDKIDSPLKA